MTPIESVTVPSEELRSALVKTMELCNVVRELNNEVEIEDLIAGLPEDEFECVVARSVNCGLAVAPTAFRDVIPADWGKVNGLMDHRIWAFIADRDEGRDLLEKVAERMGFPPVESWNDTNEERWRYRLALPKYVAQVAEAFDAHQLPDYELNPNDEY